ncbi:MAG: glutamate--tRNA ligase [Candidatus Micrarchaeia archaeon]
MPSIEESARKHALKNAYDYGKASPGNVVGKVIAECPDAKADMKATMQVIAKAVAYVNTLARDEIEKELSNYTFEQKKEEEKGIDVPDAVPGRVVVRFPPEPNGWPHIGHAKAFCISGEIARKYNGKIILRWDDTNPEAEKAEFVDAIKDGIRWLGLTWDEEVYCSDWLPKMYELCEKLILEGGAYACTCPQEKVAEGREKKVRCACGAHTPQKSMELWRRMLSGEIEEGGATIRLKGDMESLNTVMRDPTLFRIITTPHYRQGTKYRVWPTYDFQGAVMDSLLGITHPIRSKEYELRDELYVYLLEKLGLRIPKMISISRLAIRNAPVSKRLLRPLVESGKLWGWDDPRLPTLAGLRRRGILPEAIRKFVLSFGISKVESEPPLDAVLIENRKLLDPVAPHYFLVTNPVKVVVAGAQSQKITMPAHPTNKALGVREFNVGTEFYIDGDDATQLRAGDVFRLKELYNVRVDSIGEGAISGTYMGTELLANTKKIQWAPVHGCINAEVYVPGELLKDGEFNPESMARKNGVCEPSCVALKKGDRVQLERMGFYIVDSNENGLLKFIKCD